jgi:endo-1,3(4)-beta-glucanase
VTNGWWAPYAAPPGDATAAGPFPYESALYNNGVVFGVSTDRQWDGTSIKQPTQTDWLACFTEHLGDVSNHKATAFDTQSVAVQYFQGSSTMTFYAVPGSPYVTFEYDKATPFLTSLNGKIQSFNGQTLESGGNGMSYTVFPGGMGGIGADEGIQ